MAGHEEAFDDFPLENVAFDDFSHVRLGPNPIPHAFRVDDDAGTICAVIETSGFVGTDEPLEVVTFEFLLEKGMQLLAPTVCTAAAWIVLRAPVDADKNVMLKGFHRTSGTASSAGDGGGARAGLDLLQEGVDLSRVEQPGSGRRSLQQQGDFAQPQVRSLQLFGPGEFGGLPGGQFLEFPSYVAEVTLQVFLHGTGFAIPFGAEVCGRRQPIVGTTEEILA